MAVLAPAIISSAAEITLLQQKIMHTLFSIMLILHISAGSIALISGLFAMLTTKGGRKHRLSGKFYFSGMTAVFITAVYLSIADHIPFLLMVGFFSYHMVVSGYRSLYLKQLHRSQRPASLDWLIAGIAIIFNAALLIWGIRQITSGESFGWVALVFGSIGLSNVWRDVRKFIKKPAEKQHWWYSHIVGMGGSYIAAVTAFLVVNVHFLPKLVVWLSPTVVGGIIISLTINKYKRKFLSQNKITRAA